MEEKPPAFVVVDKRKFTAEGEIREGFVAPEPEAPKILAPEPPTVEPPAAKVVTMPARTPEMERADDLRDEEMAGLPDPLNVDGTGAELDPTGYFGEEDPLSTPRTAAETAAQDAAYRESSREIDSLLQQSNPGMQGTGVIGFEHLIQSFYLSAIMAMGAGTEPGQKPRIDILAARQSIDMLGVLEAKTRGNLSPEEQQLLQGIAFELRMMFLELTNAISKQAHQPAVPPGPGLR